MSATASTVPREVPTYRQGVRAQSPLRTKVSQKWKEEMDSRDSLSMLVTLEERERLKELSRWSRGLAPRGGHTDRRTVRQRQSKVKREYAGGGRRRGAQKRRRRHSAGHAQRVTLGYVAYRRRANSILRRPKFLWHLGQ